MHNHNQVLEKLKVFRSKCAWEKFLGERNVKNFDEKFERKLNGKMREFSPPHATW